MSLKKEKCKKKLKVSASTSTLNPLNFGSLLLLLLLLSPIVENNFKEICECRLGGDYVCHFGLYGENVILVVGFRSVLGLMHMII